MSTSRNHSPLSTAYEPVLVSPANRTDLRHPQNRIDAFWSQFTSKTPGKVTSIIPQKWYPKKVSRCKHAPPAATGSQPAYASYDAAAAQCRAKVDRIVRECRRTNQKYRDPHFDLELDRQMGIDDCLDCLDNKVTAKEDNAYEESQAPSRPRAVKRVADIFDKPQFYIDGPTASDVRQGLEGDCWLMAALCTMSNKAGLVERVCVARDEAVGVYGFVFHRDGEWISEVIDDKLYLKRPDYEDSQTERSLFEDRLRANSEEAYRRLYQSSSGALYFAQCENPNETWLPLLEKAYAKAHGDYGAIDGGFTGEGIEDLTGGVTTEIYTTDILDKEHFWTHEILRVNDTFLFGCSTGVWGCGRAVRNGIHALHAYSVMRAVEIDGVRLVLLRNPWGCDEWQGPWSDGSKEWTAAWIDKLGHRFGDDGAFWISYDDLLRKYQEFDRTRLFDASWRLAAVWTSMAVPWTVAYNDCRFAFSLARPGPVVIVLSQLDDRYFCGLEGQYRFVLGFRVHRVGETVDDDDDTADYVVRTQDNYRMTRSASVEIVLAAGRYHVLVKIDARRDETLLPPEDVVRANAKRRRDKLLRIGRAYDLAHSKGTVAATAEEKAARRAAAQRREAREKAQFRKEIMDTRRLQHLQRQHALRLRRKERAKQKVRRAKEAKRAAEKSAAKAREAKDAGTRNKAGSSEPGNGNKDDKDQDEEDKFDKSGSEVEESKNKGDRACEQSDHSPGAESSHTRGRSGGPRSTLSPWRRPSSSESDLESLLSLSEISDDELEIRYQNHKRVEPDNMPPGLHRHPPPPPPPPLVSPNWQEGGQSDPWNAVAVVGLRVYYQMAEGDADSREKEQIDDEIVKVWVERPKPVEESEEEVVSDVDDSLRDATAKMHI